MRKNIGKEGNQQGQYNAMRLAKELEKIEVALFEIEPDGSIFLTFEDALEETIDAICAVHVPEPLVVPPSETEVLREQILQTQLTTAEAIEKQEADKLEQQLAQAEMFETILQMVTQQEGGA